LDAAVVDLYSAHTPVRSDLE